MNQLIRTHPMLVLKGYNVILVEKYRIKRDVNTLISLGSRILHWNQSLLKIGVRGGCEPID